ncbi:MAG: hypothetical protein KDN19_09000 [Verrucomicrobiae bacterium]|nr:hypothetical protein [Verrucomicrobiae bacterium]
MAVRYDQKTKDEVVAFIQKYNADNGRGGQSAAAEKYKISPITIANWLKKAGVKKGKKKAPAKKPGRKGGRARKAAVASSSVAGVLQRMAAIQVEIDALQEEFDQLKGQL